MELTGKTLGHYKVAGRIGKGGMGEVYAAEDLKLGRTVALKVLPPGLADHPDRRMRFEREARAVAALNHPNIVTIHSVEEERGVHFITMEMIDGKPLSGLIPRGGLELDALLSHAVAMADAVGAAHEKGIVHRDLKPDNLLVGQDGRLKVLDFGLAKLKADSGESAAATQLPTESVTQDGKILGTVSYMSPEQAEGRPVDARSDIFSLGIVLYEMATGQRPFAGDTPVSTISSILRDTPESVLERNRRLPRHLGRIVNRCLAKEPGRRYQTAIDLRNDLEVLAEEVRSGESVAVGEIAGRGPSANRRSLVVLPLLLAALAVVWVFSSRLSERDDGSPNRAFEAMKMTRLTSNGDSEEAAISPDGKYVVYVQNDERGRSLRLRQVSLPSGVEIVPPVSGFLYDPTFSPEGDQIYYVKSQTGADPSLYRTPVLGGASIQVLDKVHERISFSPDGRQFVFPRWGTPSSSQLLIADRSGENVRVVAERTQPDEFVDDAAWSPDGSVIAVAAVRWTGRMEHHLVTVPAEGGDERRITERTWGEIGEVAWLPDGTGLVFVAREGTAGSYQLWEISYPQGNVRRITNDLNSYEGVSLTSDGRSLVTELVQRETGLWIAPREQPDAATRVVTGGGRCGNYGVAWLPDGRLVYGANSGGNVDLWVTGQNGGRPTQLTFDEAFDCCPTVCPDGRYIIFESDRSGSYNLWRMDPDGRNKTRLTSGEGDGTSRCHPDGKRVLYITQGETLNVVAEVPIDGGPSRTLLHEDRGVAWFALDISPDGRSLAHLIWDDDAGRWQLAVVRLDEPGQLRSFEIAPEWATSSWASVRWAPDGEAIHYVDHDREVGNLWSLPLDGSEPRRITAFDSMRMAHFAWSPDGSRLAMLRGERNHDVVLLENFR